MRHSDPRLTAQIYTDTSQLPTFAAVEKLGGLDEIELAGKAVDPQLVPQNIALSKHGLSQDDNVISFSKQTEVSGNVMVGKKAAPCH